MGFYVSQQLNMRISILLALLINLLFVGCKENQSAEKSNSETNDDPAKTNEPSEMESLTENCYLYAKNKDTIFMTVNQKNKKVTGYVKYAMYEKDANRGSYEGTMIGDTLKGFYKFSSEGMESETEIIFWKKEDQLIRGFGETEVEGHHSYFKDNAVISFDENFALDQIECNVPNIKD